MGLQVEHDISAQRFFIKAPGGEVCELDYVRQGDRVNFTHTGVPPSLQGQGLAAQLVQAGMQWALSEHLAVGASCSYVQAYLRKHPLPTAND